MATPPLQQDTRNGLKSGKLSTASLVFIIIAASAPLTVLAGGAPTNYAVAGLLGVPIGYVVLGIILALFAVGYGRMASQIQSSGAFYVFIARGLGLRQGIAGAILALVAYNLMQIGLYGLFGFSAANALTALAGIELPWWLLGIVGWLIVGILGVNNIDFSAKVLGVIVTLEFLVVIVFSVMAIANAPEGVSSSGWQPDQFFTPGIGVLLAFTMAAFMGFESGAIYSEEAKNPERTVSRATYIAVGIIAAFYAFSAWALQMGVGPGSIVSQAQEFGPDLVFVWLADFSTTASNAAHLLFVTSLMAALIAFHNAAARYFFSLGQSGVLPAAFGRTAKNGAPIGGSLAQSILAIVVLAVFAIVGSGSEQEFLFPVVTLFTWFTNAAAFGLTFLLAVTSFAVMVWANRYHRDYSVFVKTVAPLLAGIGMAAVTALILINFNLMMDTEDFFMIWIMPAIILGSGLIGLIWGEILIRRNTMNSAHITGKVAETEPEPTAPV
ncbi:APC family permease [Corynebacterium stationis]|uniref:APC family permease n=1 Tax=Corynebacterium stationis TaxID=1705 RepID=A0AB36CNP8_9CORY|nr:APC family permease [Corynebacterium stationis]NME90473.1 APC family permease [Corynebacterium stationis]